MSTPFNGSLTNSTEDNGIPKRPDIPRTSGNFFHSLPLPQQLSQYNMQPPPFPSFESKSEKTLPLPFLPLPNPSLLPNIGISPFHPYPMPTETAQHPSHLYHNPPFPQHYQEMESFNTVSKQEAVDTTKILDPKPIDDTPIKISNSISSKYDTSIVSHQKTKPFLYPQVTNDYNLPLVWQVSQPNFDDIKSFQLDETKEVDPFKFVEDNYESNDSAVKVITSSEWQAKHLGKIPQSLWFRCRFQTLNDKSEDQTLNGAPTTPVENGTITPVEGKLLDLNKLKILVDSRGGFHTVQLKKTWNQIGKDLGYISDCSEYLQRQFEKAFLKAPALTNSNDDLKDGTVTKKKLKTRVSAVPVVTASAYEYRRTRKMLTSKGFPSEFDESTIRKSGINGEGDSIYSDWLSKQKEIIDSSVYDSSSVYTLNEIVDRNSDMVEYLGLGDQHDVELLETLYWNFLDSEKKVYISTALRVINMQPIFPQTAIKHPWNLNGLSQNNLSLVKYLRNDIETLSKPSLSVGMIFSTEGWTMEDHQLPLMDYLHAGLVKIWYFIAPDDSDKFKALVSDVVKKSAWTPPLRRSKHIDPFFAQVADSNKPWKLNTDYLFTPDYLETRGIHVQKVVQRPGEFIVKYPRVHSFWISLGVTVSESINFAHPVWLKFAVEAEISLAKQRILPNFSTFEMLINISKSCKIPSVLSRASLVYHIEIYKEEIMMREEIRPIVPNLTEKMSKNHDYYLADDDLSISIPSVVCMISNAGHQFSMSLRHFLLQYKKFEEIFDSSVAHFELLYYYDDWKLRQFSENLARDATTSRDWSEKLENSLKVESKPSYKLLKQLLSEGEKIFTDEYLATLYNEETELEFYQRFVTLGDQVEEFGNWIELAQRFLSSKHLSRKRKSKREEREVSEEPCELSLSSLLDMIKRIPTLSFYTEEMDQLINLSMEIEDYEVSARKFISSIDESNSEELHNILNLGKSFGIDLPSVTFLKEYEKTESWLAKFKELQETGIVHTFKDLDSLNAYLTLGRKIDSINEFHCDKLSKLDELCSKTTGINDLGNRILNKHQKPSEIDEVVKVLQECFEYPVDPEIRNNLLKLQEEYEEVSQKSRKFIDIIEEVDALKTSPQYPEQLDTLPKFQQIKALVDKAHTLRVIIPDFKKLEDDYFKKAEEWLKFLRRILHRQNSSPSNLKNYLSSLALSVRASIGNNLDNVLIGSESEPSSNANIYCICRLGESGSMVECECCSEWYHLSCFNLNRIKMKNKSFVCPICDDNNEHKKLYEGMKSPYKPDVAEVISCFKATQDLKYIPADEYHALKEIYQGIEMFAEVLKEHLQWDNDELKETNIHKIRFYLRKLTGCPVNLKLEIALLSSRLNTLISSEKENSEKSMNFASQLIVQLQRELSDNPVNAVLSPQSTSDNLDTLLPPDNSPPQKTPQIGTEFKEALQVKPEIKEQLQAESELNESLQVSPEVAEKLHQSNSFNSVLKESLVKVESLVDAAVSVPKGADSIGEAGVDPYEVVQDTKENSVNTNPTPQLAERLAESTLQINKKNFNISDTNGSSEKQNGSLEKTYELTHDIPSEMRKTAESSVIGTVENR